ncbi:MAG TPA: hypothetical protein VG738_16250 [Chitinophagaceae bacterium]|nr:hypothetical protein [Chitinophagaceae bacterium]
MKKLAAILFMCVLFAPTTVRLVVYIQCTIQTGGNQACDCAVSSTPADQNTSLPEKQKEMLGQADTKYLLTESHYLFQRIPLNQNYAVYHPAQYSFTPVEYIFHPPAI